MKKNLNGLFAEFLQLVLFYAGYLVTKISQVYLEHVEQSLSFMHQIKSKHFANGAVYLLHTNDGYPVEVTDTFLPISTKDAIGCHQNFLINYELGDRTERFLIGISVASGCPIGCKFCATGKLKRTRNLTAQEIVEQVDFILSKHPELNPEDSKEFKVNMTRMGDWGLNQENVKKACEILTARFKNIHLFVSTIGIKGADFSWIKDNITLQLSLHSLKEATRDQLIPISKKMTIEELGQVRTKSNLLTTINLTLFDENDFDIELLKKYFDPKYFFIKLSPLNRNVISDNNGLNGIIEGKNLI